MESAKNLDGMLSVMKQCLSRVEELLLFGNLSYISVGMANFMRRTSSTKARHEG